MTSSQSNRLAVNADLLVRVERNLDELFRETNVPEIRRMQELVLRAVEAFGQIEVRRVA